MLTRDEVNARHAAAELLLPPGWEGLSTEEPLTILPEIAGFLRRALPGLQVLAEMEGRDVFWVEQASELYRNIHRAVIAVRAPGRPAQEPTTDDPMEMERRLAELLRWCEAASAPVASVAIAETPAATGNGSLDERAAAMKFLHPDWGNTQIAEAINCHPKSLNKPNMAKFKLAKRAIDSGREELPKANKYDENVDAFEE
jgi:hypothetical protein